MTTKSERLFEAFCQAHSVVYRRVQETDEPRPDYELEVKGQLLLAEIKQFDPNKEEQTAIERRARGEQVALGGTPGERLRRAIRSANTQFKQLLTSRSDPTLLVVYNNTPCSLHTRPYAVMTAMQGLDVVEVEVPSNLSESPRFGNTRSGPKRAMRVDANTSISAVGILCEIDRNEFQLVVYHNRYAVTPLEPYLMCFPGVIHLRLPEGGRNSVDAKWEKV